MTNYFNLPFILPFKFIPRSLNPGMHFDDAAFFEQIRPHQIPVRYCQKWVKQETTPLQCEGTVPPNALRVLSMYGTQLKTIAWTQVFDAGAYKIWELTFDVSDIADQIIFLHQVAAFEEVINFQALSEPILIASSHVNTHLITYKNSFNRDDVAWSTGITMKMRCECDIQDFEPERERNDFVDQTHNTKTLDGVASRLFQFYVGDAVYGKSGVPPYVVDLLNRVFICDYINVEGKLIQSKTGSNWKTTRARTYPLIGASIEVVEAKNVQSLQFSQDGDVPAGIVTAYNIETGFFGGPTQIPVINIEKNG